MALSFLHCLEENQFMVHKYDPGQKALVVFDTSSLLIHSKNPAGSVPDSSTRGIQAEISLECIIFWIVLVVICSRFSLLVGLLIENNFPRWKMYHFYYAMLIIIFRVPAKISHNLYLEKVWMIKNIPVSLCFNPVLEQRQNQYCLPINRW